MKRLIGFALTLVVVVALTPGSALAASVVNGDFENGTLDGWTVVNQPLSLGTWLNSTGTRAPFSGFPVPAPPQGTHAALVDENGPTSSVLLQDLVLEPGRTHRLSFIHFYDNQSGVTASPDSLSFLGPPNQQYRIDVLRQGAPPDSVAPGDVLATLFRTRPDDPLHLAPTLVTFDLTPWAGSTVLLRFAVVANREFFQAGVDAVSVESTPRVPTSEAQCKKGGWRNLADADGQPFKNQGQCVSYVVTHAK